MKNIYKIFLALALFFGVSSCTEGDLAVDTLLENVDMSGVIVRTLQAPADLVNNTEGSDSLDFEVEVQEGNGQAAPSFVQLRVYMSVWADQDLLEPVAAEQLMLSFDRSEFYESEVNNLPAIMFSITTATVLETFVVEYPVPAFLATRLEVEMPDGTIYSDYSVGEAVATGAYHTAPFLYKTIYVNN